MARRSASPGSSASTKAASRSRFKRSSVRARTGRLTPDLVEELRHRKPVLLSILTGDSCRYCEGAIDWRRPHAVTFADGTGAHIDCYEEAEVARLVEAGRRAVENPDALADGAEAMLRGLP